METLRCGSGRFLDAVNLPLRFSAVVEKRIHVLRFASVFSSILYIAVWCGVQNQESYGAVGCRFHL